MKLDYVKFALKYNSILLIILIALIGIMYNMVVNSILEHVFGTIGIIFMMSYVFENYRIIKKKLLEE